MWLDDELFEYHSVIGKCLTPGIQCTLHHAEWGDYTIKANRLGFRAEQEFSPAKKPGYARILLFGDSNAFGDGVAYEVSFCGLIEKNLHHVEVYNFAMAGFAVDQQYVCYQEIASKFEHDLVLVAPTVETIRKLTARFVLMQDKQHVQHCLQKPYYEIVNDKLQRGHVPVLKGEISVENLLVADRDKVYRANPFADVRKLLNNTRPVTRQKKRLHLMDRLSYFLKKLRVDDSITKVRPYPEYDTPNTPAWQIMNAILVEWTLLSPKPVVVVPLPSYIYVKERADATNYQRRFHEVEKAVGCSLYDPLPDLMKLSLEERRELYYLEGHLTPLGHAWMGKKISSHIRRILKK